MSQKLWQLPALIASTLATEINSKVAVSLSQRIRLWRSGFRSDSYSLFGLKNNEWTNYVSDVEVTRAGKINGPYKKILKDKMLFSLLFSSITKVPEALGIIERGKLYALPSRQVTASKFLLDAARACGIVLKPIMGNKGRGVFMITQQDTVLMVNGVKVQEGDIESIICSLNDYLVTQKVQQADYAKRIFPTATNTIRLITMRDPLNNQVFIPMAMHRFGTSHTAPTDNFQTGGVSAGIDIASGVLGQAVCHPQGTGGQLTWFDNHPETGEAIKGVLIPRWEAAKETVIELMNRFSFLNYVGWDVLITDSDVVIIEGNHNINLGIQVHGPLLTNPRSKQFYQHYKVVKRNNVISTSSLDNTV